MDDDDILLRLLRYAEKTEGAAHADLEWHGSPAFVVVVTGANVGLFKRYALAGELSLIPNDSKED